MNCAICLIVKDERRDIAEWIAYHSLIGFDTQIIIDNGSTDGTVEFINSCKRAVDIRFHPWHDRSYVFQPNGYAAVCQMYQYEFDWILFIDADEYLVLPEGDTIPSFLSRLNDHAGIALNWAIYGSSNHDEYPTELLTRTFLWRSEPAFFPNRHVKSFVRPERFLGAGNPHFFHINGDYVDACGRPLEWATNEAGETLWACTATEPDFAACHVNHYFTRSKAHWIRRMQRGFPADIAIRSLEEFDAYNRNEIFDDVAVRRSPGLEQKVHALEEHAATVGLAPAFR